MKQVHDIVFYLLSSHKRLTGQASSAAGASYTWSVGKSRHFNARGVERSLPGTRTARLLLQTFEDGVRPDVFDPLLPMLASNGVRTSCK